MLNVRELISGGPARLRYVFRYSTSRVGHPESVAEHMYFVSLYALMIGTAVNNIYMPEGRLLDLPESWPGMSWERIDQSGHTPIDIAHLLSRCLVHDLEEAVSGDFPRPFKYSTPQLRKILEDASRHAFAQLIRPVWGVKNLNPDAEDELDEDDGSPDIADHFLVSWMDSKDVTPEGCILEFCDFLAVLGYLMEEGAGRGNKSIEKHVAEMDKYFLKFGAPEFEFMGPIIDQADVLMKEVFHGT